MLKVKVYLIAFLCAVFPITGQVTTTPSSKPYGPDHPYGPVHPYGGIGVPPYKLPWMPWWPYVGPYMSGYGYQGGQYQGGEEGPYEYEDQPSYAPPFPPYPHKPKWVSIVWLYFEFDSN